jgi:NAD-reducing hydrogenase small subunit
VELPLLLDKVYPIQEVVPVDYFLPGCPPPADAFLAILLPLLNGEALPQMAGRRFYYD